MITFNQNVQNFVNNDSGYLLGIKKKENGDAEIYAAQKTWWRSLGIQICRFIGIKDNYNLAEIVNIIRPNTSHEGLVQKLNGKIAKYNTNHTDSTIQQIAIQSSIVAPKPTLSSSHVSSSSHIKAQTPPVSSIAIPNIQLETKEVGEKTSKLSQLNTVLQQGIVQANSGKDIIFRRGMDLYSKLGCQEQFQTARLSADSLKNFHLSKEEKPAYFEQTFRKRDVPVTLMSTGAYYDYSVTQKTGMVDYWVDFANASLGGACFTYGAAQEEGIVGEFPDFANHVASKMSQVAKGWSDIYTRESHDPYPKNPTPQNIQAHFDARKQPLGGDPNPYILDGLTRVQVVKDLHKGLSESLKVPQKANFVAIAAPRLPARVKEVQLHEDTLSDIFNTMIAGFTLVAHKTSGNCIIHSGKIGCGAFNNDPTAVYLLHCLASEALGVEIKMYDYKPEEAKRCQALWQKIQPSLEGKKIVECIEIISKTLSDLK